MCQRIPNWFNIKSAIFSWREYPVWNLRVVYIMNATVKRGLSSFFNPTKIILLYIVLCCPTPVKLKSSFLLQTLLHTALPTLKKDRIFLKFHRKLKNQKFAFFWNIVLKVSYKTVLRKHYVDCYDK